MKKSQVVEKQGKGSVENVNLSNIFERGLLMFFRAGRWGATAKMRDDQISDDMDKDIIRAVQDLVTPEDKIALKEIRGAIRDCKRYIRFNSIPFPMDSFTFVSKEKIVDINDRLTKKQAEIAEMAEAFLGRYDKIKADFKKKYPKAYRPEKYPTPEALRNRFYIYWSFHRMEVPEGGKDGLVTPEIYKAEVERAKQTIDEMTRLATTTIANSFVRRIDSLREQAVNGEINMRTVNAVKKVLDRFEDVFKGFVNEKVINDTIVEVKKYLVKDDPEVMREDDKWQEKLAKSMTEVVKKLETLPDVKAKRRIKIDDEE